MGWFGDIFGFGQRFSRKPIADGYDDKGTQDTALYFTLPSKQNWFYRTLCALGWKDVWAEDVTKEPYAISDGYDKKGSHGPIVSRWIEKDQKEERPAPAPPLPPAGAPAAPPAGAGMPGRVLDFPGRYTKELYPDVPGYAYAA